MTLTTRQIAEQIAEAVLIALAQAGAAPAREHCTDAVLRTLRENGIWLHRTVQDAAGVIDGEAPSEVLPEVEA